MNNIIFSITNFLYRINIRGKLRILRLILISLFFLAITILLTNLVDGKTVKKNYYNIVISADSKDTKDVKKVLVADELRFKFFSFIIGNEDIAAYILKYTKHYNIDSALFFSIIKTESEFNPKAKNYNNDGSIDRGLCQLNNRTFPELSENDFFNPENNIKLGTKYLKWCLNLSDGNLIKALAYYHAGIGSVSNKNVGEYTLDYINKIMKQKENIDNDFQNFIKENSKLAVRM